VKGKLILIDLKNNGSWVTGLGNQNLEDAMKKSIIEKANILKVLAHEKRLDIITLLLKDDKLPVGNIQKRTKLSQSGTSQHLDKLKTAKILLSETCGVQRFYSINPKMKELIEYILN
jgi:ArsR family transcriptional regulator, virulence genes transcriptional regulator